MLVARLHDDDGKLSRQFARAFIGERGFGVVTTCRTLDLDGEDLTAAAIAAERQAEEMRTGRGADLIVWGQVADAGAGAVRLWFSAASVRPSMARAPWKIEQGTLGGEFQKEFALAIQAMALAAVPPASEAQGRAVAALLRPRLPPLRTLLAHPPAGLSQEDRSALRWTLADALQTFGGQAGDNAALREAVEQYRELLKEQPRERAPLDWAATQNNLGNALARLGERGDDGALRRAVAAFEAALGERTRERAPLAWAMTQNNLGSALQTMGARGDDGALRRAVAAFEAALEERTRERAPLAWAMTQNNLGNALQTMGARGDDGALRRAVAAYEAALEEYARERAPFLWAQTMENIALAQYAWGETTGDRPRFHAALTACEAALEEYRRANAPLYINKATRLRDHLASKLHAGP